MNNRALTLSLVMAVLAIFFVQNYVSRIEEEARKKFGTEVQVLVARRDVKENETLDETMFEFKSMPKRFLEPAAVYYEPRGEDADAKKEITKSKRDLAGSVAMIAIKKDEQITYNKLTEPGMRTGLAPQIAPGKRAVALPVGEITGVAKLVKAGDRVDLIGIIDMGGGKDNKLAKTLLQDVTVLAVGRVVTNNIARRIETDPYGGKDKVRSLSDDPNFASVTLEVDPNQAQMLALVLANGENALTLSLRNNDDTDRVNTGSVMLYDVLGPDINRVRLPAAATGKR